MTAGCLDLIWKETPGPKAAVIAMSVVAGLSNGLVLSIVNAALQARLEGGLSWMHLAAFLGALTVHVAGAYFAMYRATEMAGRLMHRLREGLVDRIAGCSLRTIETYGEGDIIAHVTSDVATIGSTALRLVGACRAAALAAFCFAYLAWLSPKVFLLAAAVALFGAAAYLACERAAKDLLARARADQAAYYGGVAEALDGFKEIRLNADTAHGVTTLLNRISDRFRAYYARSEFIFFSGNTISQILLFLMLGGVALLPAGGLDAAGVSTFQIVAVLVFLIAPLESLVDFVGPFLRGCTARANLDRLAAEIDAGREPPAQPGATFVFDAPLALEGVVIRYRDSHRNETFVLGPVSLSVSPGEMVFLTGGNGSGKTTLMKVLAGLYPPHEGALSLGGTAITDANRAAYRALVAAVFSDFHLFRELHGLDPLPRQEIEADLRRFGLDRKVTLQDGGFSTVDLSTGQRKRLALAVALAQKRPLLLLDEFGAEQDPAFRDAFYRSFLPSLRARGVTVIAATHDDRYFSVCDRLIKLDMGGIVADGAP
ncbi:MAG: cyclic peptide export ABC transporter [Rhodospirillaceae bacterium]